MSDTLDKYQTENLAKRLSDSLTELRANPNYLGSPGFIFGMPDKFEAYPDKVN